jgi:hypothetical protein
LDRISQHQKVNEATQIPIESTDKNEEKKDHENKHHIKLYALLSGTMVDGSGRFRLSNIAVLIHIFSVVLHLLKSL